MSSLDTGIDLDEHFDMQVDETGDIAASSDLAQLQQDLSGAITTIVENNFIGTGPLTPTLAAELESIIASRVEYDRRILSIESIDVTTAGPPGDELSVSITAVSIYGMLSRQLAV
jgi:hypothetical protein